MQKRRRRRFQAVLAVVALMAAWPGFAADDGAQWDRLQRGGYILLIRHGIAPGTGDPVHFDLDDCRTQRNLSEAGRRQSAALGEAFRKAGIPVSKVLSSQWCRCRETAALAFGGFEAFPPLNSFFGRPERAAEQTADTLARLRREAPAGGNLVLVTHQVNITALIGVFPAQGEVIVTRLADDGTLSLVDRFSP
jgi:broad specificity phosphatase PhoE